MAEVFLASTMGAEGFSRRVAIKRVLPGYSDNEAFARMFVDEAQISSQLVHPNIVSVIDFDRDADNRLFLVMELVEGKDLDALVSTGLLPIPVVIHVIAEVLRGLGYAHDLPVGAHVRGIVHRDVSPHNVLLSWEGTVKVSDFGIAKARAASEATASVFIKGKPAYMSPEQANGQALDGRSDLFAVGIMLWEMLVGRRLFVGNDTRSTLAAVLFGQIPRPRSLRGDVPKDVERVVMKLLERDLPARYATAEQAIADLLDCADAPKGGRELLIATLAERFGDQAPVRHSQQGRPRSLPPVARMGPPAASGTMPDGSPVGPAAVIPTPRPGEVPAVAMPSLGSVRNATTGTIDLHGGARAAAARRGNRIAVIVVLVAASAFGSFLIVSAMRGSRGGDGGDGAGSEVVAAAPVGSAGSAGAATPAPAPVPAPPVEVGSAGSAGSGSGSAAPTAVPPPIALGSAAPAAPPRVRRQVVHTPTTRPAAEPKDTGSAATVAAADKPPPLPPGRLRVPGHPALQIFVDGVYKDDSPAVIKLPPGTYIVKLVSIDPDKPFEKTYPVTIKPNQETAVTR